MTDLTDDQILDVISGNFIKDLIRYKMQDQKKYSELLNRISTLIQAELTWRKQICRDQEMMEYFYPEVN